MEMSRETESNNNNDNRIKPLSVYDVIGEGEQELARRQYPDDDATESNHAYDKDSQNQGMQRSLRSDESDYQTENQSSVDADNGMCHNEENASLDNPNNHYQNNIENSPVDKAYEMKNQKIRQDLLEEPEQTRKLFIGGLDYKTSEATLKQHFERFGDVIDCVVMREPQTKRSRGFGFVIYKNSSMVDRAQDARPHKVDGREVQSKRAISREDSGRPEAQATVKKVYLGGLSDDIEESELRAYFKEYGNIVNITIISHKDTGKKRGFAFVEYDDYDPVDKIVFKKFHTIKDKRVEAKKAFPKGEMDARRRGDPRNAMPAPIIPMPGPMIEPRARAARGGEGCFWDIPQISANYPSGYSGPASLETYSGHYHNPSGHYGANNWIMYGGQSGSPYSGFRNSHNSGSHGRGNYAGQTGNWTQSTDYGSFPAVQQGTGGPLRMNYQHRSWAPYSGGSAHRGRGYNS